MRCDFERVRTALLGGRPDRVPLAEVGIAPSIKAAYLGHPIASLEDDVEFWYQAGYDYVLVGRELGLGLFPGVHSGPPLGPSARGERRWAEEGQGIITNLRDYQAYPWPDPGGADYRDFDGIGALLPAGMKAILYSGPIFQWAWMLMGFETFCIALSEDIELIESVFERIGQIRLHILKTGLRKCRHIGAVLILDDIAYSEGLMVSPQILRRYLFPWFKRIVALCQAEGLPTIYHCDGAFWPVLDDLLEIGVNAIHPVEPKGMGADIHLLRKSVGHRLCLVGGVDLDVLIRGTPDDVVRATRRIIEEAGSVGAYMAGSSNTVTESVPLENYQAMRETVLRFGTYG